MPTSGDTQVQGLLATKQISAAISAGVAAGGNGTDNAFTGAMLYNGLHNTVSADISDGVSITADSIAVKAHDTTSGSDEAKGYEEQLGTYRVKESLLQDAGMDTDGSSYYKTSDADNGLDTAGETVDFDGNKGSLSVGAAFVVAGSKDNAAGAAVNVANLDNTFTAKIDNATLTADKNHFSGRRGQPGSKRDRRCGRRVQGFRRDGQRDLAGSGQPDPVPGDGFHPDHG